MIQALKMILGLWLALSVGLADAAEYRLGSGDILTIEVYAHPELEVDAVRVDENGKVSLPLLGNVAVAGMTASAAAQAIEYALESGGFLIKPHVNVFVQQYLSKQVVVLGQVNQPGKYALEGSSKVSDLLALAGGINATGSDTIMLIHNQNGIEVQTSINTLDVYKDGHLNLDEAVEGGDIIYVPRAEMVYIYGEVQHPGAFPLQKNLNVMQAIALGGGLTLRGTEHSLQIRRQDATGKVEMLPAKLDTILMPNDVVFVRESLF